MADDENTRGRARPSRRGLKLRKRSSMWQHFEETDCNDGSVKCKYCSQVFGPKSQGGNLNRHYERQCPARPDAAAAVVPPGAPLDRDPVREQEAAAPVEAPPPAPHVMEVDEQVAAVRTPALSLPRAVSSEHDHVTEQERPWAFGSFDWISLGARFSADADLLPLPSPTPPCAPSSGSGGSRDREPVLEQEEACRDLARMIALGGHDPSILEDEYFKSFVRRLNPAFQLPSRHDIEKMCDGVSDPARIKEIDGLGIVEEIDGLGIVAVGGSVAVGKANTMEKEVLYTTRHFIDYEWNLHRVVWDASVIVPDPPLRGPLLGVLEVSLGDPDGPFSVDRVISYAVCSTLPMCMMGPKIFTIVCGLTSDPWINNCIKNKISKDYPQIIPDLICTAYMDNVLHSIAQCLSSVPHIRNVHGRVSKHLMTRQQREELLSYCGLENLWAYDEPWYSCYCSLQVLCTKASSQPTYIEHMLCKLWGIIYRALRTISTSSNPTSHRCLRELFNVWQALQSEIGHKPNDEITEQALKDAKKTLDKALKDYYLVWSIPLVLDPREKLQSVELIFKSVFSYYPDKYNRVKGKIKELYSFYKNSYDEDSDDNAMAAGDADPSQQASDDQRNAQDNAELDRYLEDDPVPNTEGFDILNWWKDHGSVRYRRVARMARDALAMPTCSKLSSDQLAQVRSRLRGYRSNPDFSDLSDTGE